jgi:hypothetical protein
MEIDEEKAQQFIDETNEYTKKIMSLIRDGDNVAVVIEALANSLATIILTYVPDDLEKIVRNFSDNVIAGKEQYLSKLREKNEETTSIDNP